MAKKSKPKSKANGNNRKKTVRETTTKRGRGITKETKGDGKRKGKKTKVVAKATTKNKKLSKPGKQANKATPKRPAKRKLQKANKQTTLEKRVKQLGDENKQLKKKLAKQAKTKPKKTTKKKPSPSKGKKAKATVRARKQPKALFDTLSDRNVLKIEFTAKDYDGKIQQLNQITDIQIDEYKFNRQPLFPRTFMPILRVSNGSVTESRNADFAPPSMAVTRDNVIQYATAIMEKFKVAYFDYINTHDVSTDDENIAQDSSWIFDVDSVVGIWIRFIYAIEKA